MTVRIDDELAHFVDASGKNGEGSRAQVISAALRHEMRRREAQRDAEIYVRHIDPELESDAYERWSQRNVAEAMSDLD